MYGQSCDTLYSHENYVMRGVKIEYRDCQFIKIDSIYRIVQWNNVDSNYLKPYYSENVCYSLLHSHTGKLIQERWQEGDTIYFKSYYSSGKLRSYSKHVFKEKPYYFHDILLEYYENGQLSMEFSLQKQTFSPRIIYYPNGMIQSKGMHYDASPGAWGDYIEYFSNGKISSIRTYTQPNTSDSVAGQFQENELLSEIFYDQNGIEVEEDLNELKVMNISIYPPIKHEASKINDNLYAHHQFSNQNGYINEMSELKNKILENLKLPKGSCSKGVIWVSLIIKKDGTIEIDEVQFSDVSTKQSIEKSIQKIKKWPTGILNGEKVDVYVYIPLLLEL